MSGGGGRGPGKRDRYYKLVGSTGSNAGGCGQRSKKALKERQKPTANLFKC